MRVQDIIVCALFYCSVSVEKPSKVVRENVKE